MYLYLTHMTPTERCWLMFSPSLEIKKTCGNYLQEFHCYSPSKRWRVFHHCRPEDGWAVSAFPCPPSSSWAGKWLKKGPGLRFPGLRLLLGVILRCQVAANVLAANGREASKFTLTAECNCAEHLLMNESAAH